VFCVCNFVVVLLILLLFSADELLEKESVAPGENEFDSGFEMVNHTSVDHTAGVNNGNANADFDINNDGNFISHFYVLKFILLLFNCWLFISIYSYLNFALFFSLGNQRLV